MPEEVSRVPFGLRRDQPWQITSVVEMQSVAPVFSDKIGIGVVNVTTVPLPSRIQIRVRLPTKMRIHVCIELADPFQVDGLKFGIQHDLTLR